MNLKKWGFFIITLVVYLFSVGFLITSYMLMSAHIKITHVSGIPIAFYLSAYGFLLLVVPGVVMWMARQDGKLPLFFKIYTFLSAAYLGFFALREILKVFPMTYYGAWNLRLWPQMAFFAVGFWAAAKVDQSLLQKDYPDVHRIFVVLIILAGIQAAIMSIPL